jgi:ABC-2 type transport system permease protein
MVMALVKALWTSLMRDRMALALTFALPCVMFTVFAVIFGGTGDDKQVSKLNVIVADLDQSRASKKMVASLTNMERLAVESISEGDLKPADGSDTTSPDLRLEAARRVKVGRAAAAVIFPKGLESSLGIFGGGGGGDRTAIEVIYDPANPLAQQMLAGVLQASAFTSVPDVLMTQGLEQFRTFGGAFTPAQEAAMQSLKSILNPGESDESDRSDGSEATEAAPGSGMSMTDGLVKITTTSAAELFSASGQTGSGISGDNMISYYAAAISVMFVMFSMSGAASSLLEHEEKGTLERLLSGGVTIFRLLLAHWLFCVVLGVIQIGFMLVFASIVFGLDLWNLPTLLGTGLMALVSSMASAAFILMFATLCRSRKQLEGLSSIVILIMSAIGGSMMPRFIMPKFVLKLSSVAFNSWAMDGFLDVFWHRIPGESVLAAIAPEVAVILLMAGAFLLVASFSSRRWAVK